MLRLQLIGIINWKQANHYQNFRRNYYYLKIHSYYKNIKDKVLYYCSTAFIHDLIQNS